MGKFAILATLFRKYFTEQRMFSPFLCYTYCGGIQPLSFHLQKY